MSGGFYNYDTRGASVSTQVINLERMVKEREERISKLQDTLTESEKEIERLRTENTMITLENQRLMERRSDMTLAEIEQSRLIDSLLWSLNEIKNLKDGK